MFVVRRAFKNYGEALLPGSVVEPGNIKNFKSRLRERVIIEVPEQDFEKWNNYFKTKFGVPIAVKENTSDDTEVTTDNNSNEGTEDNKGTEDTDSTDSSEGSDGANSTEETETTETTPAKPVVKVTVTN